MTTDQQVQIFHTQWAVYIGIVYSYLPFMILPLYSALEKMDGTLLEAASDLGCPPMKSFPPPQTTKSSFADGVWPLR